MSLPSCSLSVIVISSPFGERHRCESESIQNGSSIFIAGPTHSDFVVWTTLVVFWCCTKKTLHAICILEALLIVTQETKDLPCQDITNTRHRMKAFANWMRASDSVHLTHYFSDIPAQYFYYRT